jgi:hypothetical protein
VNRLPFVLGSDSERTVVHNCNEQQTNSCDNETQLLVSNNCVDSSEDKEISKFDSSKDNEDIDPKRTKIESNEESIETEEVVTYTDSSTFLKVSLKLNSFSID